MLSARPAEIYGLADRGVLAPGKRADVNVIDLAAMTLHLPEVVHDLPVGRDEGHSLLAEGEQEMPRPQSRERGGQRARVVQPHGRA